jgi:putative ATP-binding cassette transporter
VVERLSGFDRSIAVARDAAVTPPVIALTTTDANVITLQDLSVRLPNSVPLISAENISIKLGERVLVSGPSGAGKSTLFRALAGVWPFGEGAITIPKNARMMILPQRPYFPIAPLAAAVAYPAEPGQFDAATIAQLISAVALPALVPRIEEEAHWNGCCPLGEQQRLGIARALLYCPDFLFLDEATASIGRAKRNSALFNSLIRDFRGRRSSRSATAQRLQHSIAAGSHSLARKIATSCRRLRSCRRPDRTWRQKEKGGGHEGPPPYKGRL